MKQAIWIISVVIVALLAWFGYSSMNNSDVTVDENQTATTTEQVATTTDLSATTTDTVTE